MKRYLILVAALSLCAPVFLGAQESDFRGRLSAEADYKIAKGLHLAVEAEGRFKDDFSNFSRVQAGLGVSYKLNKHFKVQGGYLFMENKNSSDVWKTRHRIYADGTYSLKSGAWRFALKERLQLTHKVGGNVYQNTPNLFASKTRFKLSYAGFDTWKPYALLEARVVFNDPSIAYYGTQLYDDEDDYYYNRISDITYTDTYLNRVRGGLGAEFKLSRNHSIDLYALLDYCYDKEIDTNKKGTRLKSLEYTKSLPLTIGAGYKFAF